MHWLKALENQRILGDPPKERRDRFETAKPLELRMFRVEKGEAILLTFSNGRAWLIDGGNSRGKSGNELLAEALQEYLEKNDLKLEACLASHSHFDHIGAYTYLLGSGSSALKTPVKMYRGEAKWGRSAKFLSERYRPFVANNPNLVTEQIINPGVAGHITVGIEPGVDAHLFVDHGVDVYDSVMMLLEYHKARILFTGDLNDNNERSLLKVFKNHPIDLFSAHLLKITHHGSEHGSSKEFVAAVKPAFAIVSDNPEDSGHRFEDETRRRIEKTPVGERGIYQTRNQADVVVETDGADFEDGILYRVSLDPPGLINPGLDS